MLAKQTSSSHRSPAFAFVAGLLVASVIAVSIVLSVSHSKKHPASATTPAPATSHAPAPTSGAPASTPPLSLPGTNSTVVKVVCPVATHRVSNAAGLQAALTAARPGDSIEIADGTYVGHFVAKTEATSAEPIYLCGSRNAVLDGGGNKLGYVLHLDGAAFWRVNGFSVRNGQKGVVADHTAETIIANLDVSQIGDEGIHLRAFSTNDIVEGDAVHNTGLHSGKFGEGIYVGSARSNWCTYSACNPDRSDHNLVADNIISNTTAENLDIKEGTTGGIATGNHFDAVGMISADSWVDVKGDGWTIADNTGVATGTSTIVDGYQTHEILTGWGSGNAFIANVGNLASAGFGIHLTPVDANEVGCDNHIAGPAQGLSNIACINTAATGTTSTTTSSTSTTSHKHHRHNS
jgi:hypothetical protein